MGDILKLRSGTLAAPTRTHTHPHASTHAHTRRLRLTLVASQQMAPTGSSAIPGRLRTG